MAYIKIENLKKSYGELEVLKDINLEIEKGDVVAIIGSSGSGKSTLLRSLIGLETINGGTVQIDSEYIIKSDEYSHRNIISEIHAKMGMVFQSFNLFPHFSVRKNLTTPFKLASKVKLSKDELNDKCEKLLAKVGLSEKIDVMPGTLSGGQKQRVAIARALMQSPEIMFFDEPTSALDPELTGEVLNTIKQLAVERMTMLVVTHEMSFARDVATKVVFMDNGVVVEEGKPEDIFTNPQKQRTKEFLNTIIN